VLAATDESFWKIGYGKRKELFGFSKNIVRNRNTFSGFGDVFIF
jgi:hypothetical protein